MPFCSKDYSKFQNLNLKTHYVNLDFSLFHIKSNELIYDKREYMILFLLDFKYRLIVNIDYSFVA
jgi:hypothetical protein